MLIEKPKIAIITDSTCDIPQELVDEYSIIIVPQILIWDGKEYLDGVTLFPQEFYSRLASEPSYPSTSAAPIECFIEAFQEAEKREAREILVLTVSGEMSRTYQNASMAAKQTNLTIKVVDARGPSLSLGW